MRTIIPWWEPLVGEEEKRLVYEVIDSNFLNDGDYTRKFEALIAEKFNVKYVVGVTSCTASLSLALMALGVVQGDEVIVPDLTFIATANAVKMVGAVPVLVDIKYADLTIDPSQIRRAVTRRTKAIIPVHVNGRIAAMDEILKFASTYDLAVIEDAAEAFGSAFRGKQLGTFADVGCFSFAPTKVITTGQGGAVVTNRKEIYERVVELKDQGRSKRGTGGDDLHPAIGYNFKLTNLQAAIGIAQMSKLDTRLKRMKQIYQLYQSFLSDINGVSFISLDIESGLSPQWIDIIAKNRDQLAKYLFDKKIETRKFWLPIHTQSCYKVQGNFPNAEKASASGLWLPSSFNLKNEDIEVVCSEVRSFYERKFHH